MAEFFHFSSAEREAVNWASAASASLVLSYIVWLWIKKPMYLDRVSLRIQTAIAVVDLVRHLNYIFNYSTSDVVCSFGAFLFFFAYHANTFLNAAMALNLQVVYIHEKCPPRRIGLFLCIIPILVSLVIDLIPFGFNAYGRGFNNVCYLVQNHTYREELKVLLFYATNYPGLLYCFLVSVAVLIKLMVTKPINQSYDSEPQSLLIHIQDPLSRQLAFRVSLYPLACAICHMGDVLSNMYFLFVGRPNPILSKWGLIGLSFNGFANLICFFLDPFILESFDSHPPVLADQDEPDNASPSPIHDRANKTNYAPVIRSYVAHESEPRFQSEANARQFFRM